MARPADYMRLARASHHALVPSLQPGTALIAAKYARARPRRSADVAMNTVKVTSSCVIGQRVVNQYIQPHVSVYDVGLVGSVWKSI